MREIEGRMVDTKRQRGYNELQEIDSALTTFLSKLPNDHTLQQLMHTMVNAAVRLAGIYLDDDDCTATNAMVGHIFTAHVLSHTYFTSPSEEREMIFYKLWEFYPVLASRLFHHADDLRFFFQDRVGYKIPVATNAHDSVWRLMGIGYKSLGLHILLKYLDPVKGVEFALRRAYNEMNIMADWDEDEIDQRLFFDVTYIRMRSSDAPDLDEISDKLVKIIKTDDIPHAWEPNEDILGIEDEDNGIDAIHYHPSIALWVEYFAKQPVCAPEIINLLICESRYFPGTLLQLLDNPQSKDMAWTLFREHVFEGNSDAGESLDTLSEHGIPPAIAEDITNCTLVRCLRSLDTGDFTSHFCWITTPETIKQAAKALKTAREVDLDTARTFATLVDQDMRIGLLSLWMNEPVMDVNIRVAGALWQRANNYLPGSAAQKQALATLPWKYDSTTLGMVMHKAAHMERTFAQCGICHDQAIIHTVQLTCKHVFHAHCLSRSHELQCPMCRADF